VAADVAAAARPGATRATSSSKEPHAPPPPAKGANILLDNHKFTPAVLSVLSKGLKFIPVANQSLSNISSHLKTRFADFSRRAFNAFAFRKNDKKTPTYYIPTGTKVSLEDKPREKYLAEQMQTVLDKAYKAYSEHVLNGYDCNLPDNMTADERKALERLIKDDSIIIKPADKNLGPTILDREDYNKKVMSQLNDEKVYERLNPQQWEQIEQQLHEKIKTWLEASVYGTKLLRDIGMQQEEKDGKKVVEFVKSYLKSGKPCPFYGLPKIHKQPVKLRPISAAHSYCTTGLSIILGDLLQQEVDKQKQILRDTKDLISRLESIATDLPEDCLLMTADVESLYPNIPISDAINRISREVYGPRVGMGGDYCMEHAIKQLLDLVLNNHYVAHGTEFRKQVQGTAMGTNTGPPFANLFMALLEKPLMEKYSENLLLYVRYLDDILVIWKGGRDKLVQFIREFNSLYPTIKLVEDISYFKATFLDLEIYKGKRFRKEKILDIKPYGKPMNKYLYLPADSFHGEDNKLGFIRGNLIRLVCNSSDEREYLNAALFFRNRLLERGYTQNQFAHAYDRVKYTDRHKFLQVKNKTSDKRVLALILQFHPSIREYSFNSFIKSTLEAYDQPLDPEVTQFFEQIRFINAFEKNPNLASKLVRATF
jgi:hypothetical protein